MDVNFDFSSTSVDRDSDCSCGVGVSGSGGVVDLAEFQITDIDRMLTSVNVQTRSVEDLDLEQEKKNRAFKIAQESGVAVSEGEDLE